MKTITYTNNQDQQILLRGIQPIREAYNRLSPSRRSMFIAQVIYLPTK